jgi:hypothetical protein
VVVTDAAAETMLVEVLTEVVVVDRMVGGAVILGWARTTRSGVVLTECTGGLAEVVKVRMRTRRSTGLDHIRTCVPFKVV